MKTTLRRRTREQQGSIVACLILLLVLAMAIASVCAYLTGTTNITHRRCDMIAAEQYAEGAAVITCNDLNAALMVSSNTLAYNLMNRTAGPYTKNGSLSTAKSNLYQRTITSPFTNQSVTAQLWLPNVSSPGNAIIITSAKVGSATQTATVNVDISFAYGAAIISVNNGTTETGADRGTAQNGNVAVDGNGLGPLVVDGSKGLAVIANGRVNVSAGVSLPRSAYSMTNFNTANQIPDYTAQGTNNTLFDFNRFIAVANATSNVYNLGTTNNHFTNVLGFAYALSNAPGNTLEGIVVVDINSSDPNWLKAGGDATWPTLFGKGINIRGTLFYNFGAGFTPTTKFVVDADLNVNAANLSGLVANNPATYPTGYPPVYVDPSKNPTNINIAPAYQNFVAGDDLPAMLYTIGEVDIHGNANVCGVCYTPSYMEMEQHHDGYVQYFKGALLMGAGIYFRNNNRSTSIISYDPNALQSLATAGTAGKQVEVTFWQ